MADFIPRSEPSLGTMIITRDGVWEHRYRPPRGMQFAAGTSARVVVTNRSGAQLGDYIATVDANLAFWQVPPADLDQIPDGSNFEVLLSVNGAVYKVRYGRVVRREVAYPANPVNSTMYTPALYTDNVGARDTIGPFWVQKQGKTVMHNNTIVSKPYGMGNDFILWDKSATHWYAPLKSDTVKVQFSLMKMGGGVLIIALCSNYAMTNWLGVKFDTNANTVRPATGSTAGATEFTDQGATVPNTVAGTPDTYTAFYNYATNVLALYKGTSTNPVFTWPDTTNVVQHGEGHRYTGVIYRGSLLSVGPQMTYWSAKDDL